MRYLIAKYWKQMLIGTAASLLIVGGLELLRSRHGRFEQRLIAVPSVAPSSVDEVVTFTDDDGNDYSFTIKVGDVEQLLQIQELMRSSNRWPKMIINTWRPDQRQMEEEIRDAEELRRQHKLPADPLIL